MQYPTLESHGDMCNTQTLGCVHLAAGTCVATHVFHDAHYSEVHLATEVNLSSHGGQGYLLIQFHMQIYTYTEVALYVRLTDR